MMGSETTNATKHGWLSRRYEFEKEDPEWEQVGHFPTPNTRMRRKREQIMVTSQGSSTKRTRLACLYCLGRLKDFEI